jgi:hypothetical protein
VIQGDYDQVFLAFLDVLGFKDFVKNNDHGKVARVYDNLFSPNAELAASRGKFKVVSHPDGGQRAIADLGQAVVSSMVISDSIILWTKDGSMRSFIDIVAVTRSLLVLSIYAGLPLRGGIAMGALSFRSSASAAGLVQLQNTIVGAALVKAYSLESEQEWSGCAVDDECLDHCRRSYDGQPDLSDLATIEYLIEKKLLVQYPIPFKNEIRKDATAIDWPNANKTRLAERTCRESFEMHGKRADGPGVREKIENTIAFLRQVRPE